MKIFVPVETGVLGRATLPVLVEAGHPVRSTARGNDKADLVRRMGVEPIEVDLYDPKAVREAIAGSDAVLRLTTKLGSMLKLRDPRTWSETIRLRTTGAHILVGAATAEGVPVYVHESISFVYRDAAADWLSETLLSMTPAPRFCARRARASRRRLASRQQEEQESCSALRASMAPTPLRQLKR